jgi:tubulin polyglutamylase TTLL1
MTYLEGIYGHATIKTLMEKIDAILIHSLKSTQSLMTNDKHCFECYGYDIIIVK